MTTPNTWDNPYTTSIPPIQKQDWSNPFVTQVPPSIPTNENPDPGFLQTMGNAISYLKNLGTTDSTPRNVASLIEQFTLSPLSTFRNTSLQDIKNDVSNSVETAEDVGKDALSLGSTLANPTGTAFSQQISKVVQEFNNNSNKSALFNPMNMISGLGKGLVGFAELPIELLTETKDVSGKAIPSTPQDEAQQTEQVAGLAAQIFTQSEVASSLLPETTGLGALKFTGTSTVGQLAKVTGAETIANAAGGFASGLVSSAGKDDAMVKAISGALTFAPLGALFAPIKTLGIPFTDNDGLAGEAKQNAIDFVKSTKDDAQSLAALKYLKITPKTSISEILSNIKAFTSNDNVLQAAIESKLDIGKGIIIQDISDELHKAITDKLDASTDMAINYTPTDDIRGLLNRFKPNIGGMVKPTGLSFSDTFDQAAYYAAGDSKSSNLINQDIQDNTGLSSEDIKSHGNFIKKCIKDNATNSQPRSQVEIDQLNNDIRQRGISTLSSMQDGKGFKAADGTQWIKNGQYITDGKQTLDIDSDQAALTAGRQPGEIDSNAPVVQIPKQEFNPSFARTTYDYNIYRGANNTTLLTPTKYNQPTLDFFKQTGFVPRETVSLTGGDNWIVTGATDGKLNLENLVTKAKLSTDYSNVIRNANGIQSEFYKLSSGQMAGKAGVLNADTYFDHLYDQFKSDFKMDKQSDLSYENKIIKFTTKIGMQNPQDISNLVDAFHSRIQEDGINNLATDEKNNINNIKTGLYDFQSHYSQTMGNDLARAANTNGYYIESAGGGTYNIRFLGDGSIFTTANNFDDAYNAIIGSKKTYAYDIDGGNSNNTPTAPGSLGGVNEPFSPIYPKSAQLLDRINLTKGFSTGLVPTAELHGSIDGVLSAQGINTDFKGQVYNTLQKLESTRNNFISSTGKPMVDAYNNFIDYIKKNKFTSDDRVKLSDYMEALSSDDIMKGALGRAPTPAEVTLAKGGLKNQDIGKIQDYMYDIKQIAKSAKVGSKEFAAAQAAVKSKLIDGSTTQVYSQDVTNWGDKLYNFTQNNKDNASVFIVIKLAQTLQDPINNLNRVDFATKNDLSPEIVQAADMLDKFYDMGADTFGISQNARIKGYIPHIKTAEAVGYNPWANGGVNTDFAHEFTRMGIMKNNLLLRDAPQLAYRYMKAGFNTVKIMPDGSSFMDGIDQAKKYVDQTTQNNLSNPAAMKVINPASGLVYDHISNVQGIPDIDVQLDNALDKFQKAILPGVKNMTLWYRMATQGFRGKLAVRDLTNIMNNLFINHGTEFATKVLNSSTSAKYANDLVAKNILPNTSGLSMMYPDEDLAEGSQRLQKNANFAFTSSGQHLIYTRIAAGIYKTTYQMVSNLSSDLIASISKKADTYLKLGIDKLQVPDQISFDNLIQAGKIPEAADLLARINIKSNANVYSLHNNPLKWNGSWGKILGMSGSWGANEAQTLGNAMMRGTNGSRLGATIRYGASQAALYTAGTALGLNMRNWLISPFNLFGTGPLVGNAENAQQTASGLMSNDFKQQSDAIEKVKKYVPFSSDDAIAHVYLPYSYAAQDWVQMLEMLNKDYGVSSLSQVAGPDVLKNQKSPLQDLFGNYPKNLKTGDILPKQ